MADPTLEGRCLCGAVRFQADTPSRFVSHCHCENCRRAHGAAYVTWMGIPEARFRWTRGEGEELRHYPTETGAVRSFCGTCGSSLLYRSPRWEDEVHIAVGTLTGDPDRPPKAHVYADRAPEWSSFADSLPRFAGTDGAQPLPPARESVDPDR